MTKSLVYEYNPEKNSKLPSRRHHLYPDWRKHSKPKAMWSWHWFAFQHWWDCPQGINLSGLDHQCKVLLQHSEATKGGHKAETARQKVHKILGAPSWHCTHTWCSFGYLKTWLPTPPFPPSSKMTVKFKGKDLTSWRRSRLNHRWCWRHWHKRTCRIVSDHDKYVGIYVCVPKGMVAIEHWISILFLF